MPRNETPEPFAIADSEGPTSVANPRQMRNLIESLADSSEGDAEAPTRVVPAPGPSGSSGLSGLVPAPVTVPGAAPVSSAELASAELRSADLASAEPAELPFAEATRDELRPSREATQELPESEAATRVLAANADGNVSPAAPPMEPAVTVPATDASVVSPQVAKADPRLPTISAFVMTGGLLATLLGVVGALGLDPSVSAPAIFRLGDDDYIAASRADVPRGLRSAARDVLPGEMTVTVDGQALGVHGSLLLAAALQAPREGRDADASRSASLLVVCIGGVFVASALAWSRRERVSRVLALVVAVGFIAAGGVAIGMMNSDASSVPRRVGDIDSVAAVAKLRRG